MANAIGYEDEAPPVYDVKPIPVFKGASTPTPKPEISIEPKPMACPAYYLVWVPGLGNIEINYLIRDKPYNIATALAYLFRAGLKPNSDPVEDLLKAVNHILKEVERIRDMDYQEPIS
jgi:hypothetical protein